MSTRTAILVAAAALGVLVIALARSEEPSAQLKALEADPMASYTPPGGALVDTDAQNEGSTLGKPIEARLSRMFALAPGTSERALERALAAATAAGWMPVGRGTAPDVSRGFAADKRLPTGGAQLGVTVFLDSRLLPDDVTPPALLVNLRHNGP